MPRDRLEEYSKTVIPQRLIQFTVFSMDKTYHFMDGYLTGIEKGNPFALFGMTRCQIELLAAAYAPISIIRSLVSREPDERSVSRVDRALVHFLYGNRAYFFRKFSEIHEEPSTIPPTAEEDWKAINILTLIDKATKDPKYKNLRKDYDHLCEYLHPNLLSNFCLTQPFLKDKSTWILISRSGHTVISRAIHATVEIMAEWTDATINLVNSVEWPFGAGPFAFRDVQKS